MKIIGSDKGIHSPEFHKKKVWQTRIKNTVVTLIIAVVVGVPIYLARTEKFLISSLEVSGNSVTKSEDLESIIAENLSGNYLWIFPRSNALLYPKEKIIEDLLGKQPRLSSVEVTKPSVKSLKVAVTERSAVAEYCKDISDPSAPLECFFIDDTGYIFAPAPSFSGNVYLTYATPEPYVLPIEQTILPAEEFNSTLAFVKGLGEIDIYPRVFLVKNDEYHLLLASGTEILWNRNTALKDVHTNLASFLADKSIKSIPGFLSKVAYIDMRFGNKIFYKFRGQE